MRPLTPREWSETYRDLVHGRPCTYERRIWDEEKKRESWGMADRKTYKEGRLRARAHVRARLATNLREGATTAGVVGRLWADVIKASTRPATTEDGTMCLADVQHTNARIKVVMGARSGHTPGMLHEGMWARVHRTEVLSGVSGKATHERSYGCPACRKDVCEHIAEAAAARRAGDAGRRREDRRQRQEWRDWAEEEEVCIRTASTLRHILTARCAGVRELDRQELHRIVDGLRIKAMKMAKNQGGGDEVIELLNLATAAVEETTQATDAHWAALRAVVAGTLPAWGPGKIARKATQDVISSVRCVQEIAIKLVEQHQKLATVQQNVVQNREQYRDRMQVVLRAWREVVEHVGAARLQRDHWHVRRASDEDRRDTIRARSRLPIARSERLHFFARSRIPYMVDRKQPKPPAQPAEAALTPVQKAAAIKPYLEGQTESVPDSTPIKGAS